MYKTLVNNGRNYQAQLVKAEFLNHQQDHSHFDMFWPCLSMQKNVRTAMGQPVLQQLLGNKKNRKVFTSLFRRKQRLSSFPVIVIARATKNWAGGEPNICTRTWLYRCNIYYYTIFGDLPKPFNSGKVIIMILLSDLYEQKENPLLQSLGRTKTISTSYHRTSLKSILQSFVSSTFLLSSYLDINNLIHHFRLKTRHWTPG